MDMLLEICLADKKSLLSSLCKKATISQEDFACVSAWNKDPVFGVIGIQSGPRH